MEYLGVAKLVEHKHETGVTVKSWDLTPWGGPLVFLGPVTSPLPPKGTTVDRGTLRVDTGSGEVWKLEGGEAPPAVGPTGRGGTPIGMVPLALVALGALWLARKGR